MRRLNDADLWAGVLFVAMGVAALVVGADLTIGSADEMGEGYVPRAMATALVVLGTLLVLIAAWRSRQSGPHPIDAMRLRPILFVTSAIVAFVALAEPLGLAAAIAGSVTVGSFAGEPLRARSLVVLIGALCVSIGAVFVWGLGLPLSMVPRLGGG